MYLEYLNYQNTGPLKDLRIPFSFHNNGNPKPSLFVGENGTGKSILLSNIVDAFYEFSRKAYSNVSIQEGDRTIYYKIITGSQITIGQTFSTSYLRFVDSGGTLEYLLKAGHYSWTEFKQHLETNGHSAAENLKWNNDTESKKSTHIWSKREDYNEETLVEKIFANDVICYFPPDRYERPHWLSDNYHNTLDREHLTLTEIFQGYLGKPLIARNPGHDNLHWLLDVMVDSRPEVKISTAYTEDESEENKHSLITTFRFANGYNQAILNPLLKARKNIEHIMSVILGKNIRFGLNLRSEKSAGRFRILDASNGDTVIPTFDSLSTGEMALFNLFATIIRYADYNDIRKSIDLGDISGIVVIDEAELHLHNNLKRNILPQLIALFPKIQFLITSHSPLFILGMEEIFKSEGYDLFQLPEGIKIRAERFSEFESAYSYLTDTLRYQEDMAKLIRESRTRPLIITEGKTDWMHLKAAYENLRIEDKYKNVFQDMDLDFLENEQPRGGNKLVAFCEHATQIPTEYPMIFIADADVPQTINAFMPDNSLTDEGGTAENYFRHSGLANSKVYSFVLPLPVHRPENSGISIEHFYEDEIIKRSVQLPNGKVVRLYMGYEFDDEGRGKEFYTKKTNKCGEQSISIIDDQVLPYGPGKEKNIALSKALFAEYVTNKKSPFQDVRFDNFIPVFQIIQEILAKDRSSEKHVEI